MFLSPCLFCFYGLVLHLTYHIRKQGSTLNIPMTGIEIAKLFGGHWVGHCSNQLCVYL